MSKINPLVSISIPTYNSGLFLRECLDALNAQTYKNIEINIVDGYSKDDTVTIAEEYGVQVTLDKQGLLNARKIGSEATDGKYVLLLDSDQILEPDAIERAIKMVEKNKLDMLVLEEDVYKRETLLEHLFHYDRVLIHAVRDFSPYTGVMLPRFYRRSLLLEAFGNMPESALNAGGQDHAIIYYEAWQLSQSVDLLPKAVRHMEPSTFREIIPKFHRWGETSISARTNTRYQEMLSKKEGFRKGMFRRGLFIASVGSVTLLFVKGAAYYSGVVSAKRKIKNAR